MTTQIDAHVPVGTIIAYAGIDPDALLSRGWLRCVGTSLDASAWPELFAAIGTAWGSDGDGRFDLPALGGTFLRCVSGDSGRDPDAGQRIPNKVGGASGNAVGSFQRYGTAPARTPFRSTVGRLNTNDARSDKGCAGRVARYNSGNVTTGAIRGGDAESRPVNRYVHFLIKARAVDEDAQHVEIPVGGVVAFAGANPPVSLGSDWTLCNGAPQRGDSGEFARLFQAIRFAHGGVDDDVFVVPDYRGTFLRGVDGGAKRDPDASSRTAPYPDGPAGKRGNTGDAVGSIQPWATGLPLGAALTTDFPNVPVKKSDELIDGAIRNLYKYTESATAVDVSQTGGDDETRPTNIALDWWIRFRTQDEVPVGTVVFCAGVLPGSETWLPCDGRSLMREERMGLFEALAYTYGGDPAAGTFRLPDLRGQFLRGRDLGAGVDPNAGSRTPSGFGNEGKPLGSDAVGTTQSYATARPRKPFGTDVPSLPTSTMKVHGETTSGYAGDKGSKTIDTCTRGGDAETRCVNAYVLPYIKAR